MDQDTSNFFFRKKNVELTAVKTKITTENITLT